MADKKAPVANAPIACQCGSKNVTKSGVQTSRKGRRQRWLCKDCGHVSYGDLLVAFGGQDGKGKH